MVRYILRRVTRSIVTLFLFVTAIFFTLESLPGDFTHSFIMSPAQRLLLQQQLGLNRPLGVRYLDWLQSVFTGELGTSFRSGLPVREELWFALPVTLQLFLVAMLISFLLGVWLGKVTAWSRNRVTDVLVSMGSVTLYALFPPLVVLILVHLTAGKLGWVPPPITRFSFAAQPAGCFLDCVGMAQLPLHLGANYLMLTILACLVLLVVLLWATRYARRRQRLIRLAGVVLIVVVAAAAWIASGYGLYAASVLCLLALPLLTMVLVTFGEPMLLMRTAMMETLGEDYMIAARAKGLAARQVRDRHAARTAVLPVLSRMLVGVPFTLTGSLVVEMAYGYPGVGTLLLRSADLKDYPVVIGVIAVVGVVVLLAHLALDILNAVVDPRLRFTGGLRNQ